MKKYKVVYQWKYPERRGNPTMKDIPWISGDKRKEWGWGPKREVKARNLKRCQARKLAKYLTEVEETDLGPEDEDIKYVYSIEEM